MDHLVTRGLPGPAVQKENFTTESLLQVTAEQMPELGELGEAQRLIPLGQRLHQDLLEPSKLPGAARERGAILEQVGRWLHACLSFVSAAR